MKKHRILVLVTILVVIITMSIGMTGCGGKVIAELPDPEYFFEETCIDEINEHDDVKQVILRSNDELWTYAAAYVNLLKYSGKYQFESFDEELYPSGDYKWLFEYNGA